MLVVCGHQNQAIGLTKKIFSDRPNQQKQNDANKQIHEIWLTPHSHELILACGVAQLRSVYRSETPVAAVFPA